MKLIEPNKLNAIIQNNFFVSYMNNKKWEKLLEKLVENFGSFFIEYKLIHSEEVFSTIFDLVDFSPFFIEPILYKEIEWINFPINYEWHVNENNLKAGTKLYKQNLAAIEKIINNIGKFQIEQSKKNLKLYGYKK